MKVTLKKRNGKFIGALDVSEDCTVEEFKQLFYTHYRYYPERQRWTFGDAKGKPLMGDASLAECGVHDGSVLVFKDLGVQISWRLVFVLEYLGPLLIFPIFYFFPSTIYAVRHPPEKCLAQKVCFWLAMLHYTKRELESLFVHRFSSSTMPITSVPRNCGHYWGLFGILVGYFLFHPRYKPLWPDTQSHFPIFFLAIAMLLFELLNFKTHLILRGLRPRGTRQRGIPRGWGFDYVSCANYFYETLCWVCFSLLSWTLTSWVFTIAGFVTMAKWALKKQRNYEAQFPDYPRLHLCNRDSIRAAQLQSVEKIS